jgi:predicted nucleic acid-binding Zn ribbon protein
MSQDNKIPKYRYECMNKSCGHVDMTNIAREATRKCPDCGGTLKRIEN